VGAAVLGLVALLTTIAEIPTLFRQWLFAERLFAQWLFAQWLSHSAAYTAGFNRGAEAQWLVNMRTRWAYDYAVWRQINGPTGIFASFGGVGGYGYGKWLWPRPGLRTRTPLPRRLRLRRRIRKRLQLLTTTGAGDCVRPIEARTIDFASSSPKLAEPLRNPLRKTKAPAAQERGFDRGGSAFARQICIMPPRNQRAAIQNPANCPVLQWVQGAEYPFKSPALKR
jgi:hypothetical protein